VAFIQAHFWSQALLKQVAFYAIVPQTGRGPFPVLYLLHGLSDDHTIWQRRTRIEIYAQEFPLIVVMPDGFRGFYTDHDQGPPYGRYMIEDVIGFAERLLPAVGKRSGRCIGGLSMGGYGAMRLALAHPEMFAGAHSHSGALNIAVTRKRYPADEFYRIFGPNPRGTQHDLFALARRLKRRGTRWPKLYIDCGTEDQLISHNRAFHAFLDKLKIPHAYFEHPGGHNWDYWDLHIREALRFHARALGISG